MVGNLRPRFLMRLLLFVVLNIDGSCLDDSPTLGERGNAYLLTHAEVRKEVADCDLKSVEIRKGDHVQYNVTVCTCTFYLRMCRFERHRHCCCYRRRRTLDPVYVPH